MGDLFQQTVLRLRGKPCRRGSRLPGLFRDFLHLRLEAHCFLGYRRVPTGSPEKIFSRIRRSRPSAIMVGIPHVPAIRAASSLVFMPPVLEALSVSEAEISSVLSPSIRVNFFAPGL